MSANAYRTRPPTPRDPADRELHLRWPWWIHPAWAFALLTGSMAIVSVTLPAGAFSEWRAPKFLDEELSLTLIALMLVFFIGIVVGSGAAARGGSVTMRFSSRQVSYLRRAYRLLFLLTLLGYGLWVISALSQGVTAQDLSDVLGRSEGAIGALKENSRPIGGLTTATQFGPVALALGIILNKMGEAGRVYWVIVALAAFRAMFYAERLALIEVLIPVLVLGAMTTYGTTKRASLIRIAPIVAAPLVWGLFALFEYSRSWIYYERLTPLPFHEWVTLRLIGYYVTSFNNSALLVQAVDEAKATPYFAIDGFWNFPLTAAIMPHPGIQGLTATEWWQYTLQLNANPEFNNSGSFLAAYGEFGMAWAILFWLAIGLVVGVVFSQMTKGRLPALLAVSTLFVGLLELSRFTYWTQGRAFPVLLAVVVIAVTFPKSRENNAAHPEESLRTPLYTSWSKNHAVGGWETNGERPAINR